MEALQNFWDSLTSQLAYLGSLGVNMLPGVQYTIGLFAGKATFQFTHPKAGSSTETETTTCYCSKYGIAWHNAKTKQWKNLKFNIIEC